MQNYISISKSEAIAKFGHYFILESSDNRFGYVITEQLGQYYSIFDDEDLKVKSIHRHGIFELSDKRLLVHEEGAKQRG